MTNSPVMSPYNKSFGLIQEVPESNNNSVLLPKKEDKINIYNTLDLNQINSNADTPFE